MELETAFLFVEEYGYIALFFVLWIGFFFMPVPNEVIVMSTGFILSHEVLSFYPTWLITIFGVVMSLTTLYVLGRFCFYPLQNRLFKRPKYQEYINGASQLIERYGPFALVIGYFFPGVRHFVPFVIGSTRMNYRTFALYAYSTAAGWTTVFFMLGYFFGDNMDHILKNIFLYGSIVAACLIMVGIYLISRKRRSRIGLHKKNV